MSKLKALLLGAGEWLGSCKLSIAHRVQFVSFETLRHKLFEKKTAFDRICWTKSSCLCRGVATLRYLRSPKIFKQIDWLVGSTPLKNISQIGSFPQVGMKLINIWVATTYSSWGISNISPFTMLPVPQHSAIRMAAPSHLQKSLHPPPSAGSMVTQHGLSPFQRQGDQSSDSRPPVAWSKGNWQQKKMRGVSCVANGCFQK